MIRFLLNIFRFGFPRTILYCNGGLGDDLMLTYITFVYFKKHNRKVNIFSNRAILFNNHPAIGKVFNINQYGNCNLYLNFVNKILKTDYKIIHCSYKEQPLDLYPSIHKHIHMYDGMFEKINILRSFAFTLKPYLFHKPKSLISGFNFDYILVHSSSLSAPFAAKVKEWNMFENQFQIFTSKYGIEISKKYGQLIQIGSASDPKLENCIDLRGKTQLNELISIVSKAKLFIGLEGGIMHLARAFDLPQIVVFGGRTMPQETGYNEPNIVNLYAKVECSPCWNKNNCDFEHKCMKMITPEIVFESIGKLIKK